jgi:hypothetical protein
MRSGDGIGVDCWSIIEICACDGENASPLVGNDSNSG